MRKTLVVFLALFTILPAPAYAQGGFSDFLKSLGELGKAISDLGNALEGKPTSDPNSVNPDNFGVRGNWLDASNAQRVRFPREYSGIGYIVTEVIPGGPAAKTGLLRDDVVTHFGNTPLSQQTEAQLQSQVLSGRPIQIKLFRNGQFYETSITPEPSNQSAAQQTAPASTQVARASTAGAPPGAVNAGSCRQGPSLEAREYTQPEVLGRPSGERAQMCFYRLVGSGAEYLNFFSTGHFYHTSISGSGGFASSGAIYGTIRGTYGFQPNGVLATRVGYQGTGVSQTNRGAGSERTMDVSGQSRLQNEMTLSNCQKITYRDEVKRVQYDRTSSHPGFMVVDGVRWERYSMECPAWRGWSN
jgi:hypothetical protein